MTQPALHSTPRSRDVWLEQLRTVGLALRAPAAAAAALVGLATLALTAEILNRGQVIDFRPERWILPGVVGLLLPIGVWRGEERFGAGFLWTLPVDRRRHALAKVFAGWAWLMAAVALFVLWLFGLALLSGGELLAEETLLLAPSSLPDPGVVDPGAVRTVRRAPEPLLWLVPFTAATATYLLASALALGPRHPSRWIAGIVFGFFLLAATADAVGNVADTEWLIFAPSRVVEALVYGPYGLDALLTARTEHLRMDATLPTGKRVQAWRGLPEVGPWARATLLWTGIGLAALWAAASRHREGRRA